MLDGIGRDDPGSLRADGEDHLRDAERVQLLRVGAADQCLRLLVVQLEDLDVVEYVTDIASVRRGPISAVRTRPCRSTRSCRPPRIERGERRRREVGPRQRAHVDPDRVSGGLDGLLGRPGVADGVLPHDPLLSLVMEAVLRRGRRLVPCDGQSEGLERGHECRSMLRAARSLDVRIGPETGERPGGVEDAPSGTRRRSRDDVAREVAQCGDRSSCGCGCLLRRGGTAPRRRSRFRRRRGSSAPSRRCPSPAGSTSDTRSTHHDGPVGNSHW